MNSDEIAIVAEEVEEAPEAAGTAGDAPPTETGAFAPVPAAEAETGGGADAQPKRWEYEIRWRPKLVAGDFPKGALSLDGNEWACQALLTVNRRGVPSAAEISNCPEVFHPSARRIAMDYRFYPTDPPDAFTVPVLVKFIRPSR